jgi:hypothetical protein
MLPGFGGPEEGGQEDQSQQNADSNQQKDHVHNS